MQTTLTPTDQSEQRLTPEKVKWIVILCAVYLALPVDVVPGVGLIGDLTAFFVGMNAVKKGIPPSLAA